MAKEISKIFTEKNRAAFASDKTKQALQAGVMKNGITASLENPKSIAADTPVFSIDLDTGKVADQKQSGRCWMFAALNTFRHRISEKIGLKEFELSQNYTFFWDKYEKSNYFYENVIQTASDSLDSRKVAFLLQTPQQDGGQWDMLVSIIQKYGIVPKTAMPETKASSNSRELNVYLDKKLRRDAMVLRRLVAEGANDEKLTMEKEKMLSEVYNLLALALGTPPEVFDFSYRDEDKNYHYEASMTPQSFYNKYVGVDLGEYISVINAPTADKPYNQTYTVEMLGNVVGGRTVCHLNVSMEKMKELAIKQLSSGESVWFGCDVGQSSNSEHGIMDKELYPIEENFGYTIGMNKAERLDYGESLMTHAMVLTGVDIVAGRPQKWKVENSWGEKVGTKGYFVMTDEWMSEYTYQIVVHKALLSSELLEASQKEPVILAPWDPMGALA